jgi:citrate synthase
LQEQLAQERHLDPAIIDLLRAAPQNALPMDVLRTAVSALAFYDPDETKNDHDANIKKAIRLTSQIAMIVAPTTGFARASLVEADRSLSHSANVLLQLNGVKPSATAERALDIALILHADHELNASTFRRSRCRRHAFRYALGRHRGHRRPQRPVARRRE